MLAINKLVLFSPPTVGAWCRIFIQLVLDFDCIVVSRCRNGLMLFIVHTLLSIHPDSAQIQLSCCLLMKCYYNVNSLVA